MQSIAESRISAPVDSIGHSSVQPWSAGGLFPAVISVTDHHPDEGGEAYARTWNLTLDGRTESGYISREAAETAAREMLDNPELRRLWAAGED